jgi:hypothetical protein
MLGTIRLFLFDPSFPCILALLRIRAGLGARRRLRNPKVPSENCLTECTERAERAGRGGSLREAEGPTHRAPSRDRGRFNIQFALNVRGAGLGAPKRSAVSRSFRLFRAFCQAERHLGSRSQRHDTEADPYADQLNECTETTDRNGTRGSSLPVAGLRAPISPRDHKYLHCWNGLGMSLGMWRPPPHGAIRSFPPVP